MSPWLPFPPVHCPHQLTEAHCLLCPAWADAQKDSQNFCIGYLLRQSGIEARATLLDKREMESRREGDRLEVRRNRCRVVSAKGATSRIGIASGDRCVLPYIQTRDCLNERCAQVEIGIRNAAVARPKTGIYCELREVCEPSSRLVCSSRLTAGQSSKLTEVDCLRALRFQVRFQKGGVADLIIGVVVDILGHVAIKNLKGAHIKRI